jgi:phosphopantetheinyl transferase (holo-ACP synthase)
VLSANLLQLQGKVEKIARDKGIKSIEVTITHSRDTVMAIALAAREHRK